MRLIAILALFGLAACGADGEPERPEKKTALSINLSASAEIGVAG